MEVNVSFPFQNNFTQSTEEMYLLKSATQWMCTTVPPLIIAFGTFGNVMTLVILRRIGFGTMNLFLGALAISDLVLLYIGLFDLWLNLTFNITITLVNSVMCKVSTLLYYSSGVLSVWLIVAMTVQRAMSVVWPHRVHLLCNRRKAISFIIGIICFVLVLHAHLLYGRSLGTLSDNTSSMCTHFTEDEYSMFLTIVWPWIDLLSFSMLPFVFLVISNSVLVWKLKTSLRNVTLTAGHSDNSGVREKHTSSITLTLIVVSITFLVLSLPISILLIIWPYVISDRSYRDPGFRVLGNFIYFLTSFLWYANSAVNFYIYCLTGNKFRAEIKSLFCRHNMSTTLNETIRLQNSGSSYFSDTQTTFNVQSHDEF